MAEYMWDKDPNYWNKQLGFGSTAVKADTSAQMERPAQINTQTGFGEGSIVNQSTDQSPGWFGQGGYLDMGAKGLQAVSGLANALLGYKNYQLAQDQFAAEKGFANRNLQNQANIYNQGLMNSANVGLALAGSSMTPEQKAAYLKSVESKQLSTAPVA